MSIYIVIRQPEVCDYWSIDKVFLKEDMAKEYVDKMNLPYTSHISQIKICEKCHFTDNEDEIDFINRDMCKLAKIDTDRNGLYCENEVSQYCSIPDFYYIQTKEITQ